jgi:hypothetical protein
MTLVIGEYAMPDPERVGYDEYRAIHQVLADKVAKAKPDRAMAVALESLDEFQAWTEGVKEKLEYIHRVL